MEEENARRYHRFLVSELITVFVCGYLIYTVDTTLGYGTDLRFMIPGALLILVLLQNCGYWGYRYLLARGRVSDRRRVLKIFAFFKRLMPVLFLLYPAGLIFEIFTDASKILALITLFGGIVFILALVEHIGMYYIDIKRMKGGKRQPSELAAELSDKGGPS
ncbi:MAG: hypothetical protein Q4C55_00025 [Eubacterium sp.]|nr:hypothetical protein [Eubacterium sp.]